MCYKVSFFWLCTSAHDTDLQLTYCCNMMATLGSNYQPAQLSFIFVFSIIIPWRELQRTHLKSSLSLKCMCCFHLKFILWMSKQPNFLCKQLTSHHQSRFSTSLTKRSKDFSFLNLKNLQQVWHIHSFANALLCQCGTWNSMLVALSLCSAVWQKMATFFCNVYLLVSACLRIHCITGLL